MGQGVGFLGLAVLLKLGQLLVQFELRRLLQLLGNEPHDDYCRNGRHQVQGAPAKGRKEDEGEGAGEQEAQRPAALDEGVVEAGALALVRDFGDLVDLVHVGRVDGLLGESEPTEGTDQNQQAVAEERDSGRDQGRQAGDNGGSADSGHHALAAAEPVDDGADSEADDRGADGDPGVDCIGLGGGPAEFLLHGRQEGAEKSEVEYGDRPGAQRQDGGDGCVVLGENREPAFFVRSGLRQIDGGLLDGHYWFSFRGLRARKESAIWSNFSQLTPSWELMCSMRRSSMSSTWGRPETSGWMVMVKTA